MRVDPIFDFHAIAAAVRDYAIFLLDPTGTIRSWNVGAERIKGYRADEIIGQRLDVFYPPEARAAGRPAELLDIAEREGRAEEEGWRLRKDGSRFWANVVISAIRGDGGALLGFAKITRDLTERRAFEESLRQSEERLRLMIASVQDYAIFLLDPDGRVATWNPGAERIKGYRPADIIGEHFSRFYPEEALARGLPAHELEVAARTGRFEDEGWRLRKDGTRFWANVVLSAVRDERGRLVGYTKVTRDLTQRREAELARMAAEREAATQRDRIARAQEAVRERDEFISVAAHELRTPLTALALRLDSLTRLTEASPDRRIADRVALAGRQVARLTDLVERMLDMSRIILGRLELKRGPTDLGEVLRETLDDFRDQAADTRTELSVSIEGDLRGEWDRGRIGQVVTNLVSNALKYGHGKPVQIRARGDRERVHLEITDHGMGIAPRDVERIFQRFERAAPVARAARRAACRAAGRYGWCPAYGCPCALSAPGEGSTFAVELPR